MAFSGFGSLGGVVGPGYSYGVLSPASQDPDSLPHHRQPRHNAVPNTLSQSRRNSACSVRKARTDASTPAKERPRLDSSSHQVYSGLGSGLTLPRDSVPRVIPTPDELQEQMDTMESRLHEQRERRSSQMSVTKAAARPLPVYKQTNPSQRMSLDQVSIASSDRTYGRRQSRNRDSSASYRRSLEMHPKRSMEKHSFLKNVVTLSQTTSSSRASSTQENEKPKRSLFAKKGRHCKEKILRYFGKE